MNTRIRVNTIPARVTTAAVSSLRGVLTPLTTTPPSAVRTPALTDTGLPRLTFTVTARRVRGVPLTLPAGRYHLTAVDDRPAGMMPGAVMLMQLPPGMSLDAAMASAAAASDAPPAFFNESIMPGGTVPGPDGIGESIIDLVPGEWIVAGYAMTTEPTTMTVTGAMPAMLPEPAAHATITIHDGGAVLSEGSLRKGRNIVRIDNIGTQPYIVTIDRMPVGTTAASVEASLRSASGVTPTATPVSPEAITHVASTVDQSAGTSMWMALDLEPGTYAVGGDLPEQGMYTIVTVR